MSSSTPIAANGHLKPAPKDISNAGQYRNVALLYAQLRIIKNKLKSLHYRERYSRLSQTLESFGISWLSRHRPDHIAEYFSVKAGD